MLNFYMPCASKTSVNQLVQKMLVERWWNWPLVTFSITRTFYNGMRIIPARWASVPSWTQTAWFTPPWRTTRYMSPGRGRLAGRLLIKYSLFSYLRDLITNNCHEFSFSFKWLNVNSSTCLRSGSRSCSHTGTGLDLTPINVSVRTTSNGLR